MYNLNQIRNIGILCFTAGILLIGLHLYWFCYPLFSHWGMVSKWSDLVLAAIVRSGFLDRPGLTKLWALLGVTFGVLASPSRREPTVRKGLSWLGLLFSLGVYGWAVDYREGGLWYIGATLGGMVGVLYFLTQLVRHMPLPWSPNDPLGRRRSGFPQDGKKRGADAGLSLRGSYVFKGRRYDSWVNVVNPRRGILVLGTPGAGKTRYIIEPLIRQLMERGTALFVFDYKYDALTRFVLALFQANKCRYPNGTAFHCINFSDLSTTARCNVLAPASLEYVSDAVGASRTVLLSLNKSWVERQGDFWVESSVNFVAALIWYLRRYRNGLYCTLPHVIELSKQPYETLFQVLGTEPAVAALIDPFIEAYNNKSKEMLDGQMASAKIPLARLASPDLYYVLTGNDVDLEINKRAAPSVLCLGGDPRRKEALAPILSLYIDRLARLCNRPGQYPCALVCDEFASVRAHAMLDTMATGRANDIITLLAVQDISQLRTRYSRSEADEIVNISGNLICGQVGGETARMMSERFPRVLRERSSVSINTNDTTTSMHQDWEEAVSPATVANLSSGEFLGVLADEPTVRLENKAFHASLLRSPADEVVGVAVPAVRVVTAAAVEEAFDRVRAEIDIIVAEVRGEEMG